MRITIPHILSGFRMSQPFPNKVSCLRDIRIIESASHPYISRCCIAFLYYHTAQISAYQPEVPSHSCSCAEKSHFLFVSNPALTPHNIMLPLTQSIFLEVLHSIYPFLMKFRGLCLIPLIKQVPTDIAV